jgi:hypothetical protein
MEVTATAPDLVKLYESDYCLWLEANTNLLRERRLAEIDLDNLVAEIEGMSRRERDALFSNLKIALLHLLKYRYQPAKRSNSWRSSLREHRQRILRAFKNSPSLKPYFTKILADCYQEARELAADETGLLLVEFPEKCPFSPEEILDVEYLPDRFIC